ncbi:hypothetical protein CDAR_229731 [Caerostris darwini]|uniref:Uncharacterized protein n=1 Tax=Caerostris darwini TaxID=1538125 RepID=A0AAV4Q0Y8_9ARAC|nr:hypothetical protein CDAR_229731 [Caerostris darwini]
MFWRHISSISGIPITENAFGSVNSVCRGAISGSQDSSHVLVGRPSPINRKWRVGGVLQVTPTSPIFSENRLAMVEEQSI